MRYLTTLTLLDAFRRDWPNAIADENSRFLCAANMYSGQHLERNGNPRMPLTRFAAALRNIVRANEMFLRLATSKPLSLTGCRSNRMTRESRIAGSLPHCSDHSRRFSACFSGTKVHIRRDLQMHYCLGTCCTPYVLLNWTLDLPERNNHDPTQTSASLPRHGGHPMHCRSACRTSSYTPPKDGCLTSQLQTRCETRNIWAPCLSSELSSLRLNSAPSQELSRAKMRGGTGQKLHYAATITAGVASLIATVLSIV